MLDVYISYGISYEKNDPFVIIHGNSCNNKKIGKWALVID